MSKTGYVLRVSGMARNRTEYPPWILMEGMEGNDKKYTRIKILKTLCERLDRAL